MTRPSTSLPRVECSAVAESRRLAVVRERDQDFIGQLELPTSAELECHRRGKQMAMIHPCVWGWNKDPVFGVIGIQSLLDADRGSQSGSDSFLMKFAGDCGSSTENRRHADRLSNFIASTEWFGV